METVLSVWTRAAATLVHCSLHGVHWRKGDHPGGARSSWVDTRCSRCGPAVCTMPCRPLEARVGGGHHVHGDRHLLREGGHRDDAAVLYLDVHGVGLLRECGHHAHHAVGAPSNLSMFMSSGSCCESLWNWAEITVSSRWNWAEITVSSAKLGLKQWSRGRGGPFAAVR